MPAGPFDVTIAFVVVAQTLVSAIDDQIPRESGEGFDDGLVKTQLKLAARAIDQAREAFDRERADH